MRLITARIDAMLSGCFEYYMCMLPVVFETQTWYKRKLIKNTDKYYFHQSPTQWSPLTSRIDIWQLLAVLQESCKTNLCSRLCFLEITFLFVYIFSCDIKYNIIIWGDNTVWNRQYI